MNLAQSFHAIVEKRRSIRIYDTNAPFDSNIVKESLRKASLSPNSSNLQLWEFYHIQSKEAKDEIAKFCLNQSAATTANELVVFVTRKDLWKQRAKWNLEAIKEDMQKNEKGHEGRNKKTNSVQGKSPFQSMQEYYGKIIPNLYKTDSLGLMQYAKKVVVTLKGRNKPFYRDVFNDDIRVSVHKSCALAAQTFMLAMAAEGYGTCPMEGFDSKRIKNYLKLPKGAEINMVISCGVPKPEGIYGSRLRVPFNTVYKPV